VINKNVLKRLSPKFYS